MQFGTLVTKKVLFEMKRILGYGVLVVVGILAGIALQIWRAPDYTYYVTAFDYSEPAPESIELKIDSKVLGEQRVINIALPKSYSESGETKYPVLYMPDGGLQEDFPHIVYSIQQLIDEGSIPEMIVVGIENTDRKRDLTGPSTDAEDLKLLPTGGSSQNFRTFIADELIPEMESKYRCSDVRTVIGESLAGLFVVETALRQPALFNNYVAVSPSLWWADDCLVDECVELSEGVPAANRLFLCCANETDIYPQTTRLAENLEKNGVGFAWTFEPRMDLTHQTIFRAMKKPGLRWIFEKLEQE
ncbi:MAG: alpha/beta hydrolase-fold protein [Pirellulaceae bacterium]